MYRSIADVTQPSRLCYIHFYRTTITTTTAIWSVCDRYVDMNRTLRRAEYLS